MLSAAQRQGRCAYPFEAAPVPRSASVSSETSVRALIAAIGAASEESLGAAIQNSSDAALLAKLASAFSARGQRKNQPCDFAVAFSAASRSLVIDTNRMDSRFDLAVALEHLHLRTQARRAFLDYLSHDDSSPRAVTARAHLGRLVALPADGEVKQQAVAAIASGDMAALVRLAASTPEPVRLMGEDELLGEWADAYAKHDLESAGKALADAVMLGKALVRSGGDDALLDSASAIAAASKDHILLTRMAEAYGSYGDARRAYLVKRDDRARGLMREAGQRLEALHSPLAPRAWVYAATIAHYFGDNDSSLATIDRVLKTLTGREHRYPISSGQALWTRGLIFFTHGRLHAALGSYAAARQVLIPTHEASRIAGIETVSSEVYAYLGDADSAWRHRVEALRWSEASTDYTRRQTAYSEAAAAALSLNYYSLAEVLTRDVANSAVKASDPVFIVEAALMQSRVLLARKQPQDAMAVLDRASATLKHQPDSGSIRKLAVNVDVARGDALIALDPKAALSVLHDTLHDLENLHFRTRTVRVYDLIGAAQERLGDSKAAEEAYRSGIAETENQRAGVPDDQDRSTFTDMARALYDHLVRLLIASGNDDEALRVVRRARNLAEPVSRAQAAERETSPANGAATTIEYYVMPDALLIWITASGMRPHFERREIREASLNRLIAESVDAIVGAKRSIDSRPAAGRLFDLLLASIIRDLPPTGSVVIAPHGVLHRVPFAALYNPREERYLIESHPVTIAIGSGVEEREEPYRTALIVAAPEAASDLPPLHYATAEARIAARSFPAAQILNGPRATPSEMLKDAGAYDAVHFAGHAVWNERQPRYGQLRMAPDAGHLDGVLYAEELSIARFARTRLIVLAACDTARGQLSGSGMLGFARAFMAAGVPRVIASLWPIDDGASAILLRDFYAQLRHDVPSAEALRAAQRAAIAKDEPPSQWAAFQLHESGMPLANSVQPSVK
jgi:CHAT domain-containing protein